MFATEVITELIEALDVGPSWTDARCRDGSGATAGLFFSDQLSDIAWAKAMCAECSHRSDCLAGALERAEPWGVWGGQLFANGRILAQKRARGRPPKHPRPEVSLSA
ncbi:MAG: WhiB family transcriptional regulator [Actinomycetota bacterium]|nr:WhiB family transcriptional regulator [Actinomycetota bacterium]